MIVSKSLATFFKIAGIKICHGALAQCGKFKEKSKLIKYVISGNSYTVLE